MRSAGTPHLCVARQPESSAQFMGPHPISAMEYNRTTACDVFPCKTPLEYVAHQDQRLSSRIGEIALPTL